jgi:MinD-like ATPase involved in chromosome partitioning or flagellar assembly
MSQEVVMGKIVAIWSSEKKSGKSVVTYMLVNHMKEAAKKNLKILVCCLNLKYSALYKLFGVKVSAVGLEDLVNYQFFEDDRSELLSSIVPNSDGIYFLGSYRTTNSYVQKNIESFSKLLEELQNSFDLIVFDTVSGKENILTNLVLKRAHIVLHLFVQDNESMKELLNVKENQSPYNQETIHMVSKYRNIYPRISDIKRRFALTNVYTMDYCETLQEMKNRDSLHLYLQRETECNNAVQCISKHILEALGLMPQESSVKEKQ